MQEVIVTKLRKDEVEDKLIKFAVISAKYDGKWVFVRDKERTTLEITGGHREDGETVLESAHRELYEETGAVDYTLEEVCVYKVTIDGVASYGTLFFADVKEFGDIPAQFETAERIYLDTLPKNLTYPQIQPYLHIYAEEWLSEKRK